MRKMANLLLTQSAYSWALALLLGLFDLPPRPNDDNDHVKRCTSGMGRGSLSSDLHTDMAMLVEREWCNYRQTGVPGQVPPVYTISL